MIVVSVWVCEVRDVREGTGMCASIVAVSQVGTAL